MHKTLQLDLVQHLHIYQAQLKLYQELSVELELLQKIRDLHL
jgi:hypothetical protein